MDNEPTYLYVLLKASSLNEKFYASLSSIFFIRRHVVCLDSRKVTWGRYTPSSYTHSDPIPTCLIITHIIS